MNSDQESAALALSEFRREISVALAELRGDVRLMLQQGEQRDRRVEDLANGLTALDERLGDLERTAVTRDDLDRRSGRTITILGLVVASTGVVSSTITATVIAIVTN